MPKKGNAYLAGTVHVAKEVQTIQRYQLEPYMSEKRVKPESATVHVAKCFPLQITYLNRILRATILSMPCCLHPQYIYIFKQ